MSTRERHEWWFEPPLAEDRILGHAESRGGVLEAAIGLLILVAFVLFMVAVWPSFVLGAVYFATHVADMPSLGQFFGT